MIGLGLSWDTKINPIAALLWRWGKSAGATIDDITVPWLIEQYGVNEALKKYIETNISSSSLTLLCERFFSAAAKSIDDTYASQFPLFDVDNTTYGVKLDSNAELVCKPSTSTVAERDDYATLPLFACYDVDYTIDGNTLEPVIHAIKDIYGDFTSQPTDSLVGVMQMTGWSRRTIGDGTKKVEYRATEKAGFKPLPEGVRASDNSVRPFVIHAKYAAGFNANGRLSSLSGVQPATYRQGSEGSASISHDGQIDLWREWGEQYCGSSLVDIAFCQLMLEIKHAVLGSVAKMAGCRNFNSAFKAALGESGATRILLPIANAKYFIKGCSVSLGSGNDRGRATAYDACDIVRVLSIEEVTIDGTVYGAVYLDTDTPFNTTSETYMIAQPWSTGSTDSVLGNDGSPTSNTSGKEPFKIQGIELMLGVYEVVGDVTLFETATDGDTQGVYTAYANRRAANIRKGGSGVVPVAIGTIPKNTAGWKYVAELNWGANDQEKYPIAQQYGATSSTAFRAAQYLDSETTKGWREYLAFGYLHSGGYGGMAYAYLGVALGAAYWNIGARACGSGGNRGEYIPSEVTHA